MKNLVDGLTVFYFECAQGSGRADVARMRPHSWTLKLSHLKLFGVDDTLVFQAGHSVHVLPLDEVSGKQQWKWPEFSYYAANG